MCGQGEDCGHADLRHHHFGQAAFQEWTCLACHQVFNCECERNLIEFLTQTLGHTYARRWKWLPGLCDWCRGEVRADKAQRKYERRLNQVRLAIEEYGRQSQRNEPALTPIRRPPGPTNEEVKSLLERLGPIFREVIDRLWAAEQFAERMQVSDLREQVQREILDTFCIPDDEKSYVDADYARTRYLGEDLSGEDVKRQRAKCEICGDNRSVDRAHIIPKEYGGHMSAENLLLLCPTHHRLFDQGKLSGEEWERIKWERKAIVSQEFAEDILRLRQEAFWVNGFECARLDVFFDGASYRTEHILAGWLDARGLRRRN